MNKVRYICIVYMNGENEPLFFKRYGETEDVVRKELTEFIRQSYDEQFSIESVEKDKTKTIKKLMDSILAKISILICIIIM